MTTMRATKTTAPYGSWASPITADLITASTVRLGEVRLDGKDVYWSESRPEEAGRYVVVRRTTEGQTEDVNPAPLNARNRVHEYGGASYLPVDRTVFFVNFADQRLYRQDPEAAPEAITPETGLRYADSVADQRRGRLICVREDHRDSSREAVNTLVGVDMEGSDGGNVLAAGYDFFAAPTLSRDGSKLAWMAWNHPNMPWDSTELWAAQLDDEGNPVGGQKVAGEPGESVIEPRWSPGGELYFISDRSGWWNIYRWRAGQVEAVTHLEAEFGGPQWSFGMSSYDFIAETRIACAYSSAAGKVLALLDTATGQLEPLDTPYTSISSLRANGEKLAFIGASPTEFPAVVTLDLATRQIAVLRRSSDVTVDEDYISQPQAIEFPTDDGLTAHAYFYPPQNREFDALADERPPLIVFSHGGPTGATSNTLSLNTQFWTSRGFGVVDVNYGGSTGYGTAYRRRLNGRWGIVDVEDCTNAALYLADQGLVDRERLAIRGGSAGGYTTLACLTFKDVFKAGCSLFGVSDLAALAKETHKFESRYLDSLIGPYPEREDLYTARSPLFSADQLNCPVIFLQGLEDKIVLPNQAEMMVDALRQKGVPVAYLAFEGEQHGFRQAPNIKRALTAELYFYARIFGFELADEVEPVEIENLD